ncbi:MAG: hypothetical protein IPN08_07525 [Bacteroidales bacterium]|nr:hypothetical protein [Bacteroidales bacterium]MBK9357220.1 hypothetical protein [Bacteroidales bacterium]
MAITRILGVNVSNRTEVAAAVQKVLTRYGCSIRTRLGINDLEEEGIQGAGGLIILELSGEPSEWEKMENELRSIDKIEVNRMDFRRENV